ncbi:hypothetical protein P153DRAFT_112607 [Dothidotthia symphoricarpi CBS 119687]|uniref:Uncharacterized protein n=1 Tax=Dothidotthia symphoricarpi CBS 119687 TaxID=1392245 RepID=A0A6A6A1K3_9PLEO|nr:uncharacterized protein P153DRAFT_112607 [Dothidotthia symphoricarpi CBS 119687]KAF2125406.1 hypothetical protein P153DRAFT_112607 [Dothidotthia symphoricarpi CBS 119687]
MLLTGNAAGANSWQAKEPAHAASNTSQDKMFASKNILLATWPSFDSKTLVGKVRKMVFKRTIWSVRHPTDASDLPTMYIASRCGALTRFCFVRSSRNGSRVSKLETILCPDERAVTCVRGRDRSDESRVGLCVRLRGCVEAVELNQQGLRPVREENRYSHVPLDRQAHICRCP